MKKDLISSLHSTSATSFSSHHHHHHHNSHHFNHYRSSRTNSSSSGSSSSSSRSRSSSSSSASSDSSSLLSSSMSSITSLNGRRIELHHHHHKTKPKSFKKHRYSLSRNSRSSISRLGSIQEENEIENTIEEKMQTEHDEQREAAAHVDPQDSIEYIQAIKAIRAHLNEARLQSHQHQQPQHQHPSSKVTRKIET